MLTAERQLDRIAEWRRLVLPQTLPKVAGWDLACDYQADPSTGGTYYEILPLPNRRLLLFVGDASEEGGPGDTLVLLAHSLLRSCPLSCGVEHLPYCPMSESAVRPPNLILKHLNQALAADCLLGQHLTAFCGIIDLDDGCLRFSNAGHAPPLLWHRATGTVETVDKGGVAYPLLAHGTASYHQRSLLLDRGDMLLLHNDRLLEVCNQSGQVFGRQRVAEVLCEEGRHGPDAIVAELRERLDAFLLGEKPGMEVMIMVVRRSLGC